MLVRKFKKRENHYQLKLVLVMFSHFVRFLTVNKSFCNYNYYRQIFSRNRENFDMKRKLNNYLAPTG